VKAPPIQGFGGFFCFRVHLSVHYVILKRKSILIRSYLSGTVYPCSAPLPRYFLDRRVLDKLA
jgi:hypothetical protein